MRRTFNILKNTRLNQKLKLTTQLSLAYIIYHKFYPSNSIFPKFAKEIHCFGNNFHNDPKAFLKKMDPNIVIVYSIETNLPVASGVVLDSNTFLTIQNIFQKPEKNKNNSNDIQDYYIKQNNQNLQLKFSIDYVLQEDNLAFCKIENGQIFENIDKNSPLFNNKTNLERGDQIILVSRSNENSQLIRTGLVQDDNVRSFKEFQLPCISYLTDLSCSQTSIYGSPIVNTKGKLAGIVMPIQDVNGENLIYIMPQNYLEGIINQYQQNKQIRRPYLGMSIKSAVNGSQDGAFVIKVNSEGPADKASIKLGDTIVEIDGIQVQDSGDLFKILGYQLNKQYKFKLFKDGKYREVQIQTG